MFWKEEACDLSYMVKAGTRRAGTGSPEVPTDSPWGPELRSSEFPSVVFNYAVQKQVTEVCL